MSGARADGSLPAPSEGADADDVVGRALPERYRRIKTIGEGGMGRVVIAWDEVLGREVALKEVPLGRSGASARLGREAMLTARLEHPGIVPVHDLGRAADGTAWFAMRVVRGRSLAEAIDVAGVSERTRLLANVRAAAETLAYAHHRGVVHRDIKSDNIMVGDFGETQVIDWGLARDLAEERPERAGAVVGTARAMSPEQARGEGGEPTSDVWSLGIVLLEVVAGQVAWRGHERDAVIAALVRGEAPDLGVLATCPVELGAIIRRALARDPEARYPDARALAVDLGAYLDGRRVEAHAYSPMELLWRFVRTWRTALIAGGLALLAGVTALVVALVSVDAAKDRALDAEAETRRALARALEGEAQGRLMAGDRPAAELLAARSLALVESVGARGVVMAMGSGGPLRSRLLAASAGCLEVDGGASIIVCRRADRVVGIDLTGRMRWEVVGASNGVALFERGAVVAIARPDGVVHTLNADTGRLRGHVGLLCALNSAPDVASDGALVAWNQRCARRSRGETGDVEEINACAPDDLAALATDRDGRWVELCQDGRMLAEGRPEVRVAPPIVAGGGPEAWTSAAVVSPMIVLAGTSEGRLARVDRRTGAVLGWLPATGPGMIRRIAVAEDARHAAVVGEAGTIWILDLVVGQIVTSLPRSAGSVVGWSQDELVTASGAVGGVVRAWRLARDGPRAFEWRGFDGVSGLAVAGQRVAIAHGQRATVIESDPARVVLASATAAGVMKSVAFWGDELLGADAGVFGIFHWPLGDLGDLDAFVEPGAKARRVVVMDDGTRLVALFSYGVRANGVAIIAEDALDLAGDGRSAVALLAGSHGLRRIRAGRIEDCGTAPDAVAVSVRGDDILIANKSELTVRGCDGSGERRLVARDADLLAVAGDGDFIAAGSRDGRVLVWRNDGTLVADVRAHDERVAALAFSDGALVTGGWDGRVRFFDLALAAVPGKALACEVATRWADAEAGAICARSDVP